MKRILASNSLIAAVLAVVALVAISSALAAHEPATKTHQFRCTDQNKSLYFLVYEVDGNLERGQMYVEKMQVADLTVENAGTNVIKAKVQGNAADVAFQLHKTGSVMVANYLTKERVEVCKASYKYQ